MERIEQAYNEVRDLYLNALKIFADKSFSWFQEHYSNINMLLKEYFKAAHKVYNSGAKSENKLIRLLDIKLKMVKEINFYKNI